jgi:hypothetical protein
MAGTARYSRIDHPLLPLQVLLSVFKCSHCIEPRDRIFALLGISYDRTAIRVNYARPVESVFLDAVYVIEKELPAEVSDQSNLMSVHGYLKHVLRLVLEFGAEMKVEGLGSVTEDDLDGLLKAVIHDADEHGLFRLDHEPARTEERKMMRGHHFRKRLGEFLEALRN